MDADKVGAADGLRAEWALCRAENRLRLVLEHANVCCWEYDFSSDTAVCDERMAEICGWPAVAPGAPGSLIEAGRVCAESARDFISLHEDAKRGLASGEKLIRLRTRAREKTWFAVRFSNLPDGGGAFFTARAVAAEISEAEDRFAKFLARRAEPFPHALASFSANLTENSCASIYIARGMSAELGMITTIDALADHVRGRVAGEEQKIFGDMFSRERLLGLYAEGVSSSRLETQYYVKYSRARWIRIVVEMLANPHTKCVEALIYGLDIQREKVSAAVLDKLVSKDYEFIALLDASEGALSLLSSDNGASLAPGDGDSYPCYIAKALDGMVTRECLSESKTRMCLKSVTDELRLKDIYSCAYPTPEFDGVRRCKKWTFFYLDDARTDIVFTRSDITDMYEAEQQQREILRHALAQAQQASVAKSEFLSRMSHEIRTPMNAIIGMTTLAAQAINDPQQVSDCLSKVGISARFLLSLINDILDMSRIESGKVFIKQEKIPFEEFINGINAICYAQASDKGIDYDSIMTSFTDDYYIGDAMKLQQVLINIVSNAIKFTPSGGRVQLIVHQEKVENKQARMKFIVNDTGIGIREEFIPRLFEPFEQDHNSPALMYSGTGLGLAISKGLIDMMGGSIRVNSILGVGTEFTVEVKLGLSDDVLRKTRPITSIQFNKLSALVVDDEIIVCQHTERILADMGLKAEWATSGHEAIGMVRARLNNCEYYDIILIDWKMPEMDGIETARRIRAIVGPDVTIIIITAYDWASIEAEAKQAGVNLLISKPLFRSSLCSTFEKIYTVKEQSKPDEVEVDYDFSGKRALLVEDHMLNVEVAKRLLTAKGMLVDVAENGLIALERYAENGSGHYDVILMDIRMPVMDGLTAAKSIRQMMKADAREIPIIAMSANAFDEDAEKSKAAGMDEHLTKPIEPQLLYRVLYDHLAYKADEKGE